MPKPAAFTGTTHIVAILDRSGSMAGLQAETITGFNEWLKATKKAFKGQQARLTLHLFDDRHEFPVIDSDLADVPPIDATLYFARGFTALLDAIGQSLTETKSRVAKSDRALAFIVTDGYENNSREYTREQIKGLLEKLQKKGNWTIDYLGANQDAILVGAGLGTHSTATYVPSEAGTQALWSGNMLRTASMAGGQSMSLGNRTQAEYDAALKDVEAKQKTPK